MRAARAVRAPASGSGGRPGDAVAAPGHPVASPRAAAILTAIDGAGIVPRVRVREGGIRVAWVILTTGGRWAVTGLVMLGVLLTPVHCTLVDHPHSLFDRPDAMAGMATHAAHSGHTVGDVATTLMRYGAPPLAVADLPATGPGAALPAPGAGAGADVAPVGRTGSSPVAGAIPTVAAAAMAMVADGLTALHTLLTVLLAIAVIALRPVRGVAALRGRALAVLAPPPRLPARAVAA